MRFIKQMAIALVITSLAAIGAFAKTKTESITLRSKTSVSGTVLKKGTYDLKFDEASGELSIIKDGKVLAKSSTSKENRTIKAPGFEMRFTGSGDNQQLIAVSFSGSNEDIVLNGSSASR